MRTSVRKYAFSAALLGLIVAGCSGDTGGTAAPVQPPAPAAPAAPADAALDELAVARDYFEGKRVRIVVVYGPGGAFDLIARTVAPTVGEYLKADVVVENLPGAGGILAMNTVWAEDPDGLTVVFFSGQGVTGSVLGGADGVQFELLDFEYIARMAVEPRIMMRSLGSTFTEAADLVGASGITFASSGPGGSDHIDSNVLFDALGIDGRIITGYSGSAETALAVASNDVDIASGTLLDRARTINAGDALPLLIIGDARVDLFPDTPHVLELALPAGAREVIEAQLGLQAMGYTMLAPPGTSNAQVQVLTDAFEFAMTSDVVQSRLAEQNLVRDGFLRGDDLRAIAERLLNDAPQRFREVLLAAYAR